MTLRLLFALWFAVFAAAGLRDGLDNWIAETKLPPLLADTSVEVRDRNGMLLRAYTVEDGLWRLGAAPHRVDPQFLRMLIAYEDKRFYQHSGVDLRAATRAVWQAAWHRRVLSGGSTLTMQVARLLENTGTGTWAGKLRQIRLALALERHLSKDQILSLYLTHAPYGSNLEGIRAATLAWFDKEPARLNAAEAALLIALPQGPKLRRPDRFPQNAMAARDRVLTRLHRANMLSNDTYNSAIFEPISPQKRDFPKWAPHLADRAIAQNELLERHDLTIDLSLQKALETLSKKAMFSKQDRVSVAIVVADHTNGEILASVGSSGYAANNQRAGFVDMTRAKRSPGSTLKPLIYGMGFDAGLIHPQTLIDDRPVAFGTYAPQNFDGKFRGEIRVEQALQQSLNIPVVQITERLGPAKLMAALQRSGLSPKLAGGKAGLAVALGGVGLSLEELVQLYAMQARGGQAVELHWRQSETAVGQTVLSRSSAWHVNHILSGILPPNGAPNIRIAHKTGTSYGHRDAWAIGYDGQHVAGVWMGRPDGTPVPGAFGGDIAAPLLFQVFQTLKPEPVAFGSPPPETLLVSTSQLPKPLQRFTTQQSASHAKGPKLAFPPNGARLAAGAMPLTLKLRDGRPPFSILANGSAVLVGRNQREIPVSGLGKGASVLTVIDALGMSDRVQVWLD